MRWRRRRPIATSTTHDRPGRTTPGTLTVESARVAFERHVLEDPLPLRGTLHLDGWFEDSDDFLPVWGAREFYLGGDPTYARMDDLVVFVDKRSGAVRRESQLQNLRRVHAMTPVATAAGG